MKRIPAPIKELEIPDSSKELKKYRIPEFVYLLNKEYLFAIKNAPSNFKNVRCYKRQETKSQKIAFGWPFKSKRFFYFRVIEVDNEIIWIYEIWPDVLFWTKTRYTIIEGMVTSDSQSSPEIGILKIEPGFPDVSVGNPVYSSKEELKKDPIYKSLPNEQKQKLIERLDKDKAESLIFVNKTYDFVTPEFMQHLFLGDFEGKNAKGVHYYQQIMEGNVRTIDETLKPPNKKGVWEAEIEVLDRRSKDKKWKTKNEPSTFFPNHWNTIKLLDEIGYAVKNKVKISLYRNDIKLKSKTSDDIPVEIWTDGKGVLKTIYPIYEPD